MAFIVIFCVLFLTGTKTHVYLYDDKILRCMKKEARRTRIRSFNSIQMYFHKSSAKNTKYYRLSFLVGLCDFFLQTEIVDFHQLTRTLAATQSVHCLYILH